MPNPIPVPVKPQVVAGIPNPVHVTLHPPGVVKVPDPVPVSVHPPFVSEVPNVAPVPVYPAVDTKIPYHVHVPVRQPLVPKEPNPALTPVHTSEVAVVPVPIQPPIVTQVPNPVPVTIYPSVNVDVSNPSLEPIPTPVVAEVPNPVPVPVHPPEIEKRPYPVPLRTYPTVGAVVPNPMPVPVHPSVVEVKPNPVPLPPYQPVVADVPNPIPLPVRPISMAGDIDFVNDNGIPRGETINSGIVKQYRHDSLDPNLIVMNDEVPEISVLSNLQTEEMVGKNSGGINIHNGVAEETLYQPHNPYLRWIEGNSAVDDIIPNINKPRTRIEYVDGVKINEYGNNGYMQIENGNEVGKRINMERFSNRDYTEGLGSYIDGLRIFYGDDNLGKEINDLNQNINLLNTVDEAKDLEIEARQKKGVCGPSRDSELIERNVVI